jgi:amidase
MRVSKISASEQFNRYAMRKPTRHDLRPATAAGSAEALATLKLANTPMSDLINVLANGRVTATALTKGYLSRIEAHDRDRTMLNSVREINPDALTIASKLDDTKPSVKRPLFGIPVLVKDNIATGDDQATTAGSLALKGARAKDDATVVKLLRDAGAVILGKANLTEFANMLAMDMPPGYSSLAGQVRNPYRRRLRTTMASRSCPQAAQARVRRSPWRQVCARPRSAPRLRARCSIPPVRMASSL